MDLLRLYHLLPAGLQSYLLGRRGRRLQRERYGSDIEARVAEILERDSWTAGDWEAWRAPRLRAFLEDAKTHVPWYAAHGGAPDDLATWPILTKDDVRRAGADLLDVRLSERDLRTVKTSGSTGSPLVLRRDLDATRDWYALFEARCRRWYDVRYDDRWAIFGGQLVTPVERTKPPFWIWNAGMQQLYCSSYHLADDTIGAYLDALDAHAPVYVIGYPSALTTLARGALALQRKPGSLRLAITNGESLSSAQRLLIEQGLGVIVRDTYGMAEIAAAGCESETGRMHLWPEVGPLEVLDALGAPVAPGTSGRAIATGIVNRAMPLVRYEIGDHVTMAPEDESGPPGPALPILASIDGRKDDVIRTPDGREVGRLDPVLKGDLPIGACQFIQTAPDHIRIRVVPLLGYDEQTSAQIQSELAKRVGAMAMTVEEVEEIPLGANGKFRTVVSELD